jgi:hypothetical protein
MSLGNFISQIKDVGVAKQELFMVEFDNEQVTMFCETANAPSFTIETVPFRTQGAQFEMPIHRNYEAMSLSFYVDQDYQIKNYFDQWMDSIVDPKSFKVGFRNTFVKDMNITALNKADEQKYSLKLVNAYPKYSGNILYTASGSDVVRLQVQICFERVEVLSVEQTIKYISNGLNVLEKGNSPLKYAGKSLDSFKKGLADKASGFKDYASKILNSNPAGQMKTFLDPAKGGGVANSKIGIIPGTNFIN